MWPLVCKADALILTTLAMEFASATALHQLMLIPTAESASLAHPTVSPASPTPSAMPAMLDSTSPMESASLPLSLAQADSSDTMEFATQLAQLAAALKETSAKEFALQDHGHTTTVATELAQPSTPLTMLALIPAQLEPLFRTESVSLALKVAQADSSGTVQLDHAPAVNILALSALLPLLTVLPALLDLPSAKTFAFPPAHHAETASIKT